MDETTPKVPRSIRIPESDPAPGAFTIPSEAFKSVVEYDPTEHHKATNAHFSSGWIQGPGAVTLLAEAGHDLRTVAALRGEPTTEIAFVRLVALTMSQTLLVWPTHDKDVKKVKVNWNDGSPEFNASAILRSAKMPVESKKKHRYNVYVMKETEFGPVLAIDMRFELETKLVPKQKTYSRAKAKKQAAPSVPPENEE